MLGLQVPTHRNKRVVVGVVLDTTSNDVVDRIEHVPNPRHNEAAQAREARDAVASALRAYDLAAAVLFEADYHPQARVTGGTKERLRMEGAALTACLDNVRTVEVMNGQAIGRACGGKKKDAVEEASNLGVDSEYVEAGAAALAAKSLV